MYKIIKKIEKFLKKEEGALLFALIVWITLFWRIIIGQAAYYFDDIKHIFLPLEFTYQQFLLNGKIPDWSNTFGFGHPLISWGQLGFFAPVNLLYRALKLHPIDIIQLTIATNFGIGLLGTYIFFRLRRFSKAASLLATFIFTLSGFNFIHLLHLNFAGGIMLLPWLLICLHYLFKKPTLRKTAAVGLLSAALVLSSQPQIALYCLVLACFTTIFLFRPLNKRIILFLVLAGVIGVSLSSFSIFPLLEFQSLTDRHEGITREELFNFSYPPHQAITLIAPTYFGDFYTYNGAKSFGELTAYTGIIPLIMAGIGLMSRVPTKKKEYKLALFLLITGVLFSLGKYSFLYTLLVNYNLFPPFTAPSRFLLFAIFGLSLFSAIGLEHLSKEKSYAKKIIKVGASFLYMCVIFIPFLVSEHMSWQRLKSVEITIAAFSCLIFFCLAYLGHLIKNVRLLTWSAVLITATTLVWLDLRIYPTTQTNSVKKSSSFAQYLKQYNETHLVPARLHSDKTLLQTQQNSPDYSRAIKTKKISPQFSLSSPLRTTRKHLSCLQILLTADEKVTGALTVTISDAKTKENQHSFYIQSHDVPSTGRQIFCFNPLPVEANQDLIITFSAPDENSGISVFTQDDNNPDKNTGNVIMEPLYGPDLDIDLALQLRHLNALTNTSSTRWIGAMSIDRYHDFIRTIFANDLPQVDGEGKHILIKNRQLFDSASVTHFMQAIKITEKDNMPAAGFKIVAEEQVKDKIIRLYANTQAYPRAYLVSNVIFANDRKKVLATIQQPDYKPEQLVFIEDIDNSFSQPPVNHSNINGSANITKYTNSVVEIKTTSDRSAWLILTDSFTPQWRTFLNGQPAPRFVANQLFRAAYIPAGDNTIEFRYYSSAIRFSKWLTISGLVISLILLLSPWRITERAKTNVSN